MSHTPEPRYQTVDSRYLDSDEEVAKDILASLNFRNMPYERAVIVTAAHVQKIRAAAVANASSERGE